MKTRAFTLCLLALTAASAAWADATSKAAKIAELLQLSRTRQMLHEVDGKFDQKDAARAWGRFYSENITESELDVILAYYRSPAGQADVSASRAALERTQHYMVEKKRADAAIPAAPGAAGSSTATPSSMSATADARAGSSAQSDGPGLSRSAAGTNAAAPPSATAQNRSATATTPSTAPTSSATSPAPSEAAPQRSTAPTLSATATPPSDAPPPHPWDSPPRAPNGVIISSPTSPERCEIAPSVAPTAHAVAPSGRSVVCVCTDEQGTLVREPVIAESSGDSRVDSGAIKMARVGSGQYVPPTLNGRPQSACFRFAIDFRHPAQ